MAQDGRSDRQAHKRNAPAVAPRPADADEQRLRQDVLRIEIPVFEDDVPFSVLPLAQLGVAVVTNQNELGQSTPQRSIAFYDENLQLRWKTAVEIAAEYQYLGYRVGEDSLYFALSCMPHYKSPYPLASLTVCLADGAWRLAYRRVELPPKLEILSMQMREDGWGWLALEKDEYVWFFLPMRDKAAADSLTDAAQTETPVRMPLGLDNRREWCHIATDSTTVYTLFRDRKLRMPGLTLCRHGWQDVPPATFDILPPDDALRLVDAKLSVLPEGRLWVGGTYHLNREKQTVSTYDRGSETTGLFAALYDRAANTTDAPRRLTFWKRAYYDFPDLENRLSREAWFDLQRAQEKSKGRTVIPAFTTQIRAGRTPATAQLYVLGEVYTRAVQTTTEMYYDAYGRMVPYTRTYFEGFRFRDGFLARFDSLGHAVSESVFDLDRNRLYNELTDYCQWATDTNGRTLYFYPDDERLTYRVLEAVRGTSGEPATFSLPPLFQYDKVQKSWDGVLTPWYGRHYLASGYQQIRNSRLGNGRRDVFYL
ncbi:MAG: hypothetical protein K2K51_00230, partial [Bacteroidales bacterium]|nr:hypothetical protein [Bacteroidales bacterium]